MRPVPHASCGPAVAAVLLARFAASEPWLRAQGQPFDVLIRNGLVVDGTGTAGRIASVGIREGRIVEVGPAEKTKVPITSRPPKTARPPGVVPQAAKPTESVQIISAAMSL